MTKFSKVINTIYNLNPICWWLELRDCCHHSTIPFCYKTAFASHKTPFCHQSHPVSLWALKGKIWGKNLTGWTQILWIKTFKVLKERSLSLKFRLHRVLSRGEVAIFDLLAIKYLPFSKILLHVNQRRQLGLTDDKSRETIPLGA